jgi:hypothetical protein
MLVFALPTAKYIIRSAGYERLMAMLAEPQRVFLVRQHETEHELNSQQKRMKIPNNHEPGGRLVKQGNWVSVFHLLEYLQQTQ